MTGKNMDIQELLASAKNQTFDLFERKLNTVVREHHRFSNLNESNKKVVLGLIKKYLPKIRSGQGLSNLNMRQETHELYKNRLALNLTEEDLKDIKEILGLFEK